MTRLGTDRTDRTRAAVRRADTRSAPAPSRSPHVSDAEFEQAWATARQQAAHFANGSPNLDAEQLSDAASDAVIAAARVFRPGPRSFPSYAYEQVQRALLDVARGRGRQVETVSLDAPLVSRAQEDTEWRTGPSSLAYGEAIPTDAPGPLEALLAAETSEERAALAMEMRAAVLLLPPFERKIIDFRYWGGKTQIEVALLLGISQARVQRTEASAKERLRAILAPAVDVGCDGC